MPRNRVARGGCSGVFEKHSGSSGRTGALPGLQMPAAEGEPPQSKSTPARRRSTRSPHRGRCSRAPAAHQSASPRFSFPEGQKPFVYKLLSWGLGAGLPPWALGGRASALPSAACVVLLGAGHRCRLAPFFARSSSHTSVSCRSPRVGHDSHRRLHLSASRTRRTAASSCSGASDAGNRGTRYPAATTFASRRSSAATRSAWYASPSTSTTRRTVGAQKATMCAPMATCRMRDSAAALERARRVRRWRAACAQAKARRRGGSPTYECDRPACGRSHCWPCRRARPGWPFWVRLFW